MSGSLVCPGYSLDSPRGVPQLSRKTGGRLSSLFPPFSSRSPKSLSPTALLPSFGYANLLFRQEFPPLAVAVMRQIRPRSYFRFPSSRAKKRAKNLSPSVLFPSLNFLSSLSQRRTRAEGPNSLSHRPRPRPPTTARRRREEEEE